MSKAITMSGVTDEPVFDELPDRIADWWCVDDVLELDGSLTDHQTRLVLRRVEMDFDAEAGINWGVISDTITALRVGGEL